MCLEFWKFPQFSLPYIVDTWSSSRHNRWMHQLISEEGTKSHVCGTPPTLWQIFFFFFFWWFAALWKRRVQAHQDFDPPCPLPKTQCKRAKHTRHPLAHLCYFRTWVNMTCVLWIRRRRFRPHARTLRQLWDRFYATPFHLYWEKRTRPTCVTNWRRQKRFGNSLNDNVMTRTFCSVLGVHCCNPTDCWR